MPVFRHVATPNPDEVAHNRQPMVIGGLSAQASQPKLGWPPTKEDLQRLYVEEKLSATKIAKVYNLDYANPKTAESTVLYRLKRNGIARRDPAAHNRKATAELVDEWVARYQKGESLKQIAGESFSPVTVFNHLRKRGLQLRDKVEAQIEAVTKFEKRQFSGDRHDKAYIVGLAIGDLATTTHGRAVRVRLGTTHPAMTSLFRSLFERYGPIYEYPHQARLTGFEWSLDCDLGKSFAFLLNVKESARIVLEDRNLFLDFLAGFFDAEGSIYYHDKGLRESFELSITNTNLPLLRDIGLRLERLGAVHVLQEQRLDREKLNARGIANPGEFVWRIIIWRHSDVNYLLRLLPLRHPEKMAKKNIALRLPMRPSRVVRARVLSEWDALRQEIETEVDNYVARAREAWETKSRDFSCKRLKSACA